MRSTRAPSRSSPVDTARSGLGRRRRRRFGAPFCLSVAFQLSVQGAAIEAEHLGGQRLVAPDRLEDAQDVTPFDFLHRQKLGWVFALYDDPRRFVVAKLFGQIVDA